MGVARGATVPRSIHGLPRIAGKLHHAGVFLGRKAVEEEVDGVQVLAVLDHLVVQVGPLLRPVLPTSPMMSPRFTFWPRRTSTLLMWP